MWSRPTLLPTSLVGSYAQPEWLIDRAKLAGRFPPRVRAKELWRVDPVHLREAQDDATLLAIRAQEEAGLDIITDGEMRRESYSNHFATALDGVDIDNPGTALDRSGHPNPVPRIAGPIERVRPIGVEDVKFLRAHTDRTIKMTVGTVHDVAAGTERLLPGPRVGCHGLRGRRQRRDPRPARSRRGHRPAGRALHAGSPRGRARLRPGRAQCGARRSHRYDGRAHLLRLRGDHPQPTGGVLLPPRARRLLRRPDLHRDGTVGPGPRRARRPRRQDDHPGRDRPLHRRRRDGRHGRRPGPTSLRPHHAGEGRRRDRLRDEVSAATERGRQDARDVRRSRRLARRAVVTADTGTDGSLRVLVDHLVATPARFLVRMRGQEPTTSSTHDTSWTVDRTSQRSGRSLRSPYRPVTRRSRASPEQPALPDAGPYAAPASFAERVPAGTGIARPLNPQARPPTRNGRPPNRKA